MYEFQGIWAFDQEFAHMGYVKYANSIPDSQVFGVYSFVGDRHGIAGKRDHFCPQGLVRFSQCSFFHRTPDNSPQKY